ncbi:MAG: hypothetical protein O3A20_11525 [Planctomycetota bacterium]|nr:hypothetical protein [Planctomycetota bacterium]
MVTGTAQLGVEARLRPEDGWRFEQSGWLSLHWALIQDSFGANGLDFETTVIKLAVLGIGLSLMTSLCAALPVRSPTLAANPLHHRLIQIALLLDFLDRAIRRSPLRAILPAMTTTHRWWWPTGLGQSLGAGRLH